MTIQSLMGIYNADGGIVGEVRYVVGHLLGTAECALCDITHSPIRRKPEWDQMVSQLTVPFVLLHRNELDAKTLLSIRDIPLPVVLGFLADGRVTPLLSADDLRSCEGSVVRCGEMLREKLAAREPLESEG